MSHQTVNGRYLRVRELLHNPGVQRHDEGAFASEPGGLTSAQLRDERDITYAVTLEAQGARVSVHGTAQGSWVGPCRRCLNPTEGEVRADIDEVFETRHVPGETWPISDGVIDLEPVLREALLLELPLAPVCRDDCAGPDPDRYPTVPVDEAEPAVVMDPRWAALDGLTVDDPHPGGAEQ